MSYLRSGFCFPLPFATSTQRRDIGGADIISALKLRIARTFIVGSHGVTERSFVESPKGFGDRAGATKRRRRGLNQSEDTISSPL